MRRRRTDIPPNEVNIVSLMDILTTLLFFILMVASFSNYSGMTIAALTSGEEKEEKKVVFSLHVRILSDRSAQVELGPVQGLKMVDERKFLRYMTSRYSGNAQNGFVRKIFKKTPEELLGKVREVLVPIKQAFPHENKVIITFSDKVKYQHMIDAMTSVKTLNPEEEAFLQVDLIGRKEKSRVLFAQVILGEDA